MLHLGQHCDRNISVYFFEPENREEFAASARLLAEDRKLYDNLSGNSLELAKSYDRRELAAEMLGMIEKVIKQKLYE